MTPGEAKRFTSKTMFTLTPGQLEDLKSLRVMDGTSDVTSSALLRNAIVVMKRNPEFYAAVVAAAREEDREISSENIGQTFSFAKVPIEGVPAPKVERDDLGEVRNRVKEFAAREGISRTTWIARNLLDTTDEG